MKQCECRQGFYLKNNNCYAKRCFKDLISCRKCEDDKCVTCKDNSSLIEKKCQCNKGFYFDKKNDECKKKQCTKKIQLCEKCNGDNICTQCKKKSNYDSSKNICLCKNGYLFDHVKDQCISNNII